VLRASKDLMSLSRSALRYAVTRRLVIGKKAEEKAKQNKIL
jgi:hypothetical protein